MGGMGSGRPRLSDAEKKAKGTFRADESEEARLAKNASKVITGVFFAKVPEPSLPLDAVGKAYYFNQATLLLNGNKLTSVTCGDCERMAVMHQQMHARLLAGKPVSMDLIKRMDAISVRLGIAEVATPIANPGQQNKFARSGFFATATTRVSKVRLRSS